MNALARAVVVVLASVAVGVPLGLLLASAVFAQMTIAPMFNTKKPVECGRTYPIVADRLSEKFGEEVVLIGSHKQSSSTIAIWHNDKTGGFSVVEILPNGIACIVTSGANLTIANKHEFDPDKYRADSEVEI